MIYCHNKGATPYIFSSAKCKMQRHGLGIIDSIKVLDTKLSFRGVSPCFIGKLFGLRKKNRQKNELRLYGLRIIFRIFAHERIRLHELSINQNKWFL